MKKLNHDVSEMLKKLEHLEARKLAKTQAGRVPLLPAQVARLEHHWQPRHRKLVGDCWRGRASLRAAIECQCLDCVGEDRQAVAECGDHCCPLWRYRPYQLNRRP